MMDSKDIDTRPSQQEKKKNSTFSCPSYCINIDVFIDDCSWWHIQAQQKRRQGVYITGWVGEARRGAESGGGERRARESHSGNEKKKQEEIKIKNRGGTENCIIENHLKLAHWHTSLYFWSSPEAGKNGWRHQGERIWRRRWSECGGRKRRRDEISQSSVGSQSASTSHHVSFACQETRQADGGGGMNVVKIEGFMWSSVLKLLLSFFCAVCPSVNFLGPQVLFKKRGGGSNWID